MARLKLAEKEVRPQHCGTDCRIKKEAGNEWWL
jgi:hypothetical protein